MKYDLKRSSRKSIGLQILPDGSLLVRAPLQASIETIETCIRKKTDWIEKHQRLAIEREKQKEQDRSENSMTADECEAALQKLGTAAVEWFPSRVRTMARQIGVTYGRITIRSQRTRWGSCSGKGNLNFNCLLMQAPEEVRLYVIVHELCHRLHMDHSPAFWAEVQKHDPAYKEHIKWLKDHGAELSALLEPFA